MEKPLIFFIVPPFTERTLYADDAKPRKDKKDLRVYPSLGVSYLIAALERDRRLDYEIELLDAPAENLGEEEILERILLRRPAIVAITMTTFTLAVSHRLVTSLKLKAPYAKIILGGVHLNHSPGDFQYFDADYALRGDCEASIKQLAEAILEKTDIKGIPGIIFRETAQDAGDTAATSVVITEPAVISDLDSLAFPDRSRLTPENYVFYLFEKNFATLIGSRGCPFKCIYCGLPHNKQHKKRSVDNILLEVSEIKSRGYKYISFCDDIFTLDRQRTLELCDRIITERLDINWGCSTRADCVDSHLLGKMKEAGCLDVRFGIESGNERVRKEIIHKNISNDSFITAVADAQKAGLITTGYFIFGQPGETYDQMRETAEFAKKLNLDYAYFGISMIIPNSELYDIALKEKKVDSSIWKDIISGKKEIPFYIPDGMTLDRMMALRDRAHRSFYLRPGYIISQLRAVRSLQDLVFKTRMGLSFLFNRG